MTKRQKELVEFLTKAKCRKSHVSPKSKRGKQYKMRVTYLVKGWDQGLHVGLKQAYLESVI